MLTIFPQRLTSSPTCFSSFVYSSLLLSGVDPPLLKIDLSFFFLCPSTVLISISPHIPIYLYSPTSLIFGWIEISSNLPLSSSKSASCVKKDPCPCLAPPTAGYYLPQRLPRPPHPTCQTAQQPRCKAAPRAFMALFAASFQQN